MAETRLTYALPDRDPEQLHAELLALGIAGFSGVCGSGDTVQVVFAGEVDPADVARVDAAVAAHVPDPTGALQRARAAAGALLARVADHQAVALRAVVLAVLDELNALRQRDRDRAADVAAAANLADLKQRWAARPALADRTAAQAKQAVADAIAGGAAD